MRRSFRHLLRSPALQLVISPSGRTISRPPADDISDAEALRQHHSSQEWMRRTIGSRLQNDLTSALDWQFWCWGRDVVEIPGNGLLRQQFEQCRPPAGIKVSSCYRRTEVIANGGSRRVALWGHGLFFAQGDGPGIFLRRYSFSPCIHHCESFPPLQWSILRSVRLRAPATEEECRRVYEQSMQLLLWIALYEQAIEQEFGAEHRQRCRAHWNKSVPDSGCSWPELWSGLHAALIQAPESGAWRDQRTLSATHGR